MLNTTTDATATQANSSWAGAGAVQMQFGLTCDQGFLMLDASYRLFQQFKAERTLPQLFERDDSFSLVEDEDSLMDINKDHVTTYNDGIQNFVLSDQQESYSETQSIPSKSSLSDSLTFAGLQANKGLIFDEPLILLSMDYGNLDTAGYLGVLIFVNVFYLTLMILLTWIVTHVRNNMRHGPNNSLSRQISDRVFVSSYIFLQLTLFCKLITAVIILIHICGLTSRNMPIETIRLFYHASGLFLCVAYLIALYQWLFIAMRVNLYGGKFGVRAFRKRVQKSKRVTSIASSVIFSATFCLILVEVFTHFDQVTQAVSMLTVVQFSSLLVAFIVTGSLIIRNLWVYFDQNYNQQRRSLLAALLLTILSLVVLLFRYSLEFVYHNKKISFSDSGSEDPAMTKISTTACLLVILVSDLLPIVTQMLCIWISSKGRWDSLMSGFLHKQYEEDTTYAGSVILDDLRAELFAGSDTLIFNSQESSEERRRSSVETDWVSIADLIPNNIGLQSSRRTQSLGSVPQSNAII